MGETPHVRDEFVSENPRETLGCSASIPVTFSDYEIPPSMPPPTRTSG